MGVHVAQTALALPAYTSRMLQFQACTSLPPSQVVFLGAPVLQNFTAVLWVAWVDVTLRSKYLQYSGGFFVADVHAPLCWVAHLCS